MLYDVTSQNGHTWIVLDTCTSMARGIKIFNQDKCNRVLQKSSDLNWVSAAKFLKTILQIPTFLPSESMLRSMVRQCTVHVHG